MPNLKFRSGHQHSWKETVDATRALMEAGMANEAAVSQMEATYYTICTSVLDLKEQINQVENSLSLLLAETPHTIERAGHMELPIWNAGTFLGRYSCADAFQSSGCA